jgi:hypothetical protein
LLFKKLKGLICYLKNLKDQSVINVKLKGPMNAFCLLFLFISIKKLFVSLSHALCVRLI